MGIVPPAEEIQNLKKMAEKAPQMTPEEQERRSDLLAQAYLKEQDALVRAEMVRTLAHFKTQRAAAAITAARSDKDPDVRIKVCDGLGLRDDAEAAGVLSQMLASDPDIDVRLAAARAMAHSHNPAAVNALGVALDDPNPAMQYRAVQSLKASTGKDLGNDVERWRQYVRGELKETQPTLAERMRKLF